EAAKIQGFVWEDDNTLALDENTYLVLALRYKELASGGEENGGGEEDVPFDIDGHLTEIDTGKIDADYMNSRFDKYLKILSSGADAIEIQNTVNALHQSFASLSQEQQKYADIFLRDVQRGDVTPEQGKTFRDYISEYQSHAKNAQVRQLLEVFALDEGKFNALLNANITAANINEFGRFDALKNTVDKAKAKHYFEQRDGESLSIFKVNMKIDTLFQDFIIKGGFDLEPLK
ncbi:MAG: type I restriction endonuclease subunit R, partial [Zetaproteobacteria bacterium]|nr:type I restriction endonuclease subunit R [Zetaproteobacteria bacterium]